MQSTNRTTGAIELGSASAATLGVLPGYCDIAIGIPAPGLRRD